MLDVRTGDAAAPSAVLPIDDAADKSMSGLLAGALVLGCRRRCRRLVVA